MKLALINCELKSTLLHFMSFSFKEANSLFKSVEGTKNGAAQSG